LVVSSVQQSFGLVRTKATTEASIGQEDVVCERG